ncbi:MAG: hypothetical protein AB1486_15545 [Planctomycetota bacterium]
MDQTQGQGPTDIDRVVDLNPVADAEMAATEAAPIGTLPIETGAVAPTGEETQPAQTVYVKYCLFCHATIPAEALACSQCGKHVAIFEGKVYKQFYWMFYAGLALFIGTLLPFGVFTEGAYVRLSGYETIPGAISLFLSILLMVGVVFGIYAKRFLMGPILLMFVPGVWSWWRVVQAVLRLEDELAAQEAVGAELAVGSGWYQMLYKIDYHEMLWGRLGSGMLLVWAGSSIVLLVFLVNFFGAIFGGGSSKKAKGEGRGDKPRERSKARDRKESKGRDQSRDPSKGRDKSRDTSPKGRE